MTPEELRQARQAGAAFSSLSLNAAAGFEEDSAEPGYLLGQEDAVVVEAVARHWDELPRREQQVIMALSRGLDSSASNS